MYLILFNFFFIIYLCDYESDEWMDEGNSLSIMKINSIIVIVDID